MTTWANRWILAAVQVNQIESSIKIYWLLAEPFGHMLEIDLTSIPLRCKFTSIFIFYFGLDSSTRSRPSSAAARQSAVTAFSPYLNYDPRILQQSQPEFIFPEGASKQRGRFELAFSQIGSSVMVSLISVHNDWHVMQIDAKTIDCMIHRLGHLWVARSVCIMAYVQRL